LPISGPYLEAAAIKDYFGFHGDVKRIKSDDLNNKFAKYMQTIKSQSDPKEFVQKTFALSQSLAGCDVIERGRENKFQRFSNTLFFIIDLRMVSCYFIIKFYSCCVM
jgi:hypothetical protein